jgi:alpha-glucosidase
MDTPPRWWQQGVIYQVYPRSFQDSNGDGIGDLLGIITRLDYFRFLGVNALWISPIYPSPMVDFGYDITDHTAIHPLFGTLEDFDYLVETAHRYGLKIILDYVPNHTSDQHPWFCASRSSRTHAQRDWYIWRDPASDGGPPTNWVSVFGGSAWTWDEATGQYYYHAYLKEQPDLNWRHPDVQDAMLNVLRFWLDRGVDGFRIDGLRQLIKDDLWRDNPANPTYTPPEDPYNALLPVFTTDRPEIQQMTAKMRQVVDAYDDRLLVGELYLPIERLVTYYVAGIHLPFNFHLLTVPWQAAAIAALVDQYESALPAAGWPNWVLGNHDRPRLASRLSAAQARVAAMLLLTLRGTPTLYYGDELGMPNGVIPPESVQDPWEKQVPGLGLGRDAVRTPMPWDHHPQAGFTTGTPWLPLVANVPTYTVATQCDDPTSMLTLYRRLLALRRTTPALAMGSYTPVRAHEDVLVYKREHQGVAYLVALNFGLQPQCIDIHHLAHQGLIALSTWLDRDDEPTHSTLALRRDEGVILALR